MADIRKDQERDELHRAIWAIADVLRGSVDSWDFKSYMLGMMFYRYISECLTNNINEGEIEAGSEGFDYALHLLYLNMARNGLCHNRFWAGQQTLINTSQSFRPHLRKTALPNLPGVSPAASDPLFSAKDSRKPL